MKRCAQFIKGGDQCEAPAAYRYTWPGQNEAVICEACAVRLRKIAEAMGLPLQVIELDNTREEVSP